MGEGAAAGLCFVLCFVFQREQVAAAASAFGATGTSRMARKNASGRGPIQKHFPAAPSTTTQPPHHHHHTPYIAPSTPFLLLTTRHGPVGRHPADLPTTNPDRATPNPDRQKSSPGLILMKRNGPGKHFKLANGDAKSWSESRAIH